MPTPTDPACVFCKIIAGRIPSYKVYEDDIVFAFLDIGPVVQGHTLVVPKAHYETVMEIPPELLAAVSQRLPKIAKAVLGVSGARACHILLNNGAEAMQSVHHLHCHILPRSAGDGFKIPWTTGTLVEAEATAMAQKIHKNVTS